MLSKQMLAGIPNVAKLTISGFKGMSMTPIKELTWLWFDLRLLKFSHSVHKWLAGYHLSDLISCFWYFEWFLMGLGHNLERAHLIPSEYQAALFQVAFKSVFSLFPNSDLSSNAAHDLHALFVSKWLGIHLVAYEPNLQFLLK